jgi:hypothetical protein
MALAEKPWTVEFMMTDSHAMVAAKRKAEETSDDLPWLASHAMNPMFHAPYAQL